MRVASFLLSILLPAGAASAQWPPVFPVQDPGFYKPHELPRTSPKIPSAAAAVEQLENFFGTCSGAFVSRDGYYLTAAHCVVPCLDRAARVSVFGASAIEHDDEAVDYGGSSCAASVGGRSAVLVAAGGGMAAPIKDFSPLAGEDPAKSPTFKRLRKFERGDWAVLKVALKDGETPACLKADPARLTPGTTVWAAGFPAEASRANGHSSDGASLYVTLGEVGSSLRQSEYLRENYAEASLAVLDDLLGPLIRAGDITVIDMDAYHGQSGGPIVDARGRLRAVLVGGGSSDTRAKDFSTIGVSLAWIRKNLDSLPGVDADRVFSCQ